jgi:hypothetical protein
MFGPLGITRISSSLSEFNWKQYTTCQHLKPTLSRPISFLSTKAGAFFGSFGAYIAGHFLGRKRGLQVFSGIFIVGAGMKQRTDSSSQTGGIIFQGVNACVQMSIHFISLKDALLNEQCHA